MRIYAPDRCVFLSLGMFALYTIYSQAVIYSEPHGFVLSLYLLGYIPSDNAMS